MRSQRLEDFARRAAWNPIGVETRGSWQYIRIHPCADETELLERINGSPQRCLEVDAWWLANDDVYFLQVIASPTPGLSARLYHQETARLNLVANLQAHVILVRDFYEAMDSFARFGVFDMPNANFTDRLQPISRDQDEITGAEPG